MTLKLEENNLCNHYEAAEPKSFRFGYLVDGLPEKDLMYKTSDYYTLELLLDFPLNYEKDLM